MLPKLVVMGFGLLLLSMQGCGLIGGGKAPTADEILTLMHEEDADVVQVNLKACQRSNPYEGEAGARPKHDIYRCQIKVERFEKAYNQNFMTEQEIYLRHDSYSVNGWQIF
ncbi:hypothetical protein [Acinetobacter sp. NIPH 2699]|uniref:hypothetical protein n=1 Tax=Acinetobacter sp. NIPH 2699 TaxID=2923433 RepID=UPI001F4B2B37|nr:hypothetical protein [Acinetobacter sp. NIPH 2699]MCH7337627.1 hypothetical protein [Acinetobacter sp. NIPH 2699]